MKIHNWLPHFLKAMRRWDKRPDESEFTAFVAPMWQQLEPMLSDWGATGPDVLYEVACGLNWDAYREEALTLDADKEEARVRHIIKGVEDLLGLSLSGEVVLFGAFTAMDGYARFERGKHCVYLGVDESHGRGAYLDILIAHELAHVAREPLPEIWAGFGLAPDMTHDQFVENLPVIEHLMGEGFSCVVSELLIPDEQPWHYAYQTEDSFKQVLVHGPAVDREIHRELKNPNGYYGSLYDTSRYRGRMPQYAHYVWAWLWARHALKTHAAGDPRRLLNMCSKDLYADALSFRLPKALESSK